MKRIVVIALVLVILIYISFYITLGSIPLVDEYNEVVSVTAIGEYSGYEAGLFRFAEANLIKEDGGVITNLCDYEGSKDTLSESVGLLMKYAVESNRPKLFKQESGFLRSRMMTEKGFIKWRAGGSNAYCNASIDDLRIIGALLEAYDKWGSKEYYDLAGELQLRIYDKQVKGYNLCDLYDWKIDAHRYMTPLCYLDLHTLYRLAEFNEGWVKAEERAASIINNGRINSCSPFYYKFYDYSSHDYSLDEEYVKGKGICLTYTLITAIHMAEINIFNDELTDWLKEQMKNDRLFSWYDPITLKAVNNMKSPAIYALAAIYADKAGEKDLCRQILTGLTGFIVKDRTSRFNGGIGDPAAGYFHSFDNLNALLAFECWD